MYLSNRLEQCKVYAWIPRTKPNAYVKELMTSVSLQFNNKHLHV